MNTRFFLTNSCPEAPGIVSQQPVPAHVVHSTHTTASLHRNRVWKFGKVKRKPPLNIVHLCIGSALLPSPSSASTAQPWRSGTAWEPNPLCDLGCAQDPFGFTNRDLPILSPPLFFLTRIHCVLPSCSFLFSSLRKLRTALSPLHKAFGALTGEATPA